MGNSARIAAALALCLVTQNAKAEEETPQRLNDVVITATRLPTDPGMLGSAVSVVTGKQLEDSGVRTVMEALRAVPGVIVSQSGGPGHIASIFLRGHNSQHTKVLLNGVRLNSATQGGYDFSALTVANIDRVEVVRGPQSALYGSDAIGGVINIITRRGAPGFRGHVEGAVGTEGHRQGGLSLSGGSDIADFSLAYQYDQFEGFAAEPDNGNPERDAWHNHTLAGRFGLNVLDDGRLDLSLNYSDGESELDGFVWPDPADDPNWERNLETVAFTGAFSKPVTNWFTPTIEYGIALEDMTMTDPDTPGNPADIDTRNQEWSLRGDFFFFEGSTFTLGYDFEEQHGRNPGNDIDETLEINSVYAQHHYEYREFAALTLGIRHDDHETFGTETTYRVAASVRCPAVHTRLHGSYGTGFRAPTINDLYWPDSGWARGNPELGPETSTSFDIGLEQPLADGRMTLDITYFHSDVEDLIDWAADNTGVWMPQNVAEAEIEGVELTAAIDFTADIALQTTYTYTDHRDCETDLDLPRRPNHQAAVTVSWDYAAGSNATLSVTHVGDRFDDAANANRLESYARIDIAVRHQVHDHLQLFGRIRNLLDEEYAEARGFDTPGMVALAGIRLLF